MALSVAMQKDIGEYREKVALGLSGKSLLYIGVACAIAAVEAAVAVLAMGLSVSDVSLVVIATVLIGFLLAYTKPLKMDAVDALPLLWRQHFGTNKLIYKSTVSLAREEEAKTTREAERQKKKNLDKAEKKELADVRKKTERYAEERRWRGARSAEILLPIICGADADGSAADIGARVGSANVGNGANGVSGSLGAADAGYPTA